MTREEVKRLFFMISAVRPHFHAKDTDGELRCAVDGWHAALEDLDFEAAKAGLHGFLKDEKWLPAPADIRAAARAAQGDEMDAMALRHAAERRKDPGWTRRRRGGQEALGAKGQGQGKHNI